MDYYLSLPDPMEKSSLRMIREALLPLGRNQDEKRRKSGRSMKNWGYARNSFSLTHKSSNPYDEPKLFLDCPKGAGGAD
jgi:hypothetical protein